MSNKPLPYNNKRVFRKSTITQTAYDELTAQAVIAQDFLEDDKYKFIRDLLTNARDYAESAIVENRIMNVQEVTVISQTLTKIFSNPKQVQVDELSGQYKLVQNFFQSLQEIVDLKIRADEEIANEKLEIIDG